MVSVALIVRFRVNSLVWPVGTVESMTLKVCVVTPPLAIKGVPLKIPGPRRFRNNPLGNGGLTDHVYGGFPPVAVNWILGYVTFTVPFGRENGAMIGCEDGGEKLMSEPDAELDPGVAALIEMVNAFCVTCAVGVVESITR
jgi:hypothetical protein